MPTLSDIRDDIDLQHESVWRIFRAYKVRRAAIFGSVARGEATADSDVDLLVDFEKEADLLDQAGLKLELEELLKRKVHVVTPASLSKYIRDAVLNEAVYL
jgi:predicted nucleotidyltransferase